MPIGPRTQDLPAIRRTVAFYKISSYVTGSFLLLLVLMMVFRYGFGVDIELAGPYGFLALQPKELIAEGMGINLSTVILIVHGWFYVIYLAADFILWRLTRFSFGYFLFVALGGIIPFLSFFLEVMVPKKVAAIVATVPQPEAQPA